MYCLQYKNCMAQHLFYNIYQCIIIFHSIQLYLQNIYFDYKSIDTLFLSHHCVFFIIERLPIISILMNIHILGSRSKYAFLGPHIYGCKNIIGNTCILSSFISINIYSKNYNIYIHIDKKTNENCRNPVC